METNFQYLIELYIQLGGIAENVYLKKGELGRGIFPVDPLRPAKIMTPKKLLVNRNNLSIRHDEIFIKDSRQFSLKEQKFIELNYNYAWKGGGNICAAEFLEYVSKIPESVKKQLLECGFIDQALLNRCLDENGIFERFKDERVVRFEGKNVLAAIWDLVNHSSFAPPIRITPYGVKTPPIEPGSDEILHKYIPKSSPISIWRQYGFTCDCIVAYSIPLNINIVNRALVIKCAGQQGFGTKDKKNFSIMDNILSIKSLPVGCLSPSLPQENFKGILTNVGLSTDVVNESFQKIREVNLKARYDLINSLKESATGTKSDLYRALIYEIKLIENSLSI